MKENCCAFKLKSGDSFFIADCGRLRPQIFFDAVLFIWSSLLIALSFFKQIASAEEKERTRMYAVPVKRIDEKSFHFISI